MLQMRPNCESCDKDLAATADNAYICTFECTFCEDCAKSRFEQVCPNCGGELVLRPRRPEKLLADYPASTQRVVKDHD